MSKRGGESKSNLGPHDPFAYTFLKSRMQCSETQPPQWPWGATIRLGVPQLVPLPLSPRLGSGVQVREKSRVCPYTHTHTTHMHTYTHKKNIHTIHT